MASQREQYTKQYQQARAQRHAAAATITTKIAQAEAELALVVGTAVLLAAMYWHDLTQDIVDRVLVPHNVFLLWLVFPVLNALHEFGHAFATKAYGGEVHEMGVMFLVFIPCPYVDASAAAAFRAKWHRIIVGAAGMLVELFLASLALCAAQRRAGRRADRDVQCHVHRRHLNGALQWQPSHTL